MSISDERLARFVDTCQTMGDAGDGERYQWWDDLTGALTELQSLRAAAKVRAIREGGEADIVRAANGLLNTLWQGVYSGGKTFEENWQEMERRYPQSKWLHDAAKALNATQEGK